MARSVEDKAIVNLEMIEKWAFQGMIDKDMAYCLEIGYSTFRKIKRHNVALSAI